MRHENIIAFESKVQEMKPFNNDRMRFVFAGIVLCSTFALPLLLIGQAQEASNNRQESSEVVLLIAGYEYRYQPRPELGFVVIAKDDSDAMASVQNDLSLFTQNEIIPVGGRDRHGLWIVENKQSSAQNEAAIKTLSLRRQVQYVAPLFSSNGETVAVIPEIVIRVKPSTEIEEVQSICEMAGCTIIKRMEFTQQEYLIEVSGYDADAVFVAVERLNEISIVEWACPNTASEPKLCGQVIPDDEYFPMQWHLHNSGQSGGITDADINAPEAWEITTGDPNIIVAVIDTGVDTNHPDLINNLVPGYDFYDDDDKADPALGDYGNAHGTCCAGLVAAQGGNGIGVTDVAWNCKIMPIRCFGMRADGTEYVVTQSDLASAFRWTAIHGADVVSNSWGYSITPIPIIHSAIIDITEIGGIGRDGKGCVVLFAAGNFCNPMIFYPPLHPEVIAVGATDHSDTVCWYSDYGPELDITAPSGGGVIVPSIVERRYSEEYKDLSTDLLWTTDIVGDVGYSRFNENSGLLDYTEKMSGTSGSTPVAAGIAALILSVEPDLTNAEVRHFLERSAKDLGEPGRDDYYGWGRVDARTALDMVLAARADLYKDGNVDLSDLLILIEFWGTNEPSADIAPATKRDGIVDEQDLELMMQYWQTQIPEFGLVAHWKLDETEGSIAYDIAGVADCDGILMGGPVYQPDGGMVDGALQFDGIDDYVRTNPVLNPADGSFSVFAWIKGGAPGQTILSQADGSNWLCMDSVEGYLMTELKAAGRGAAPLRSQTAVANGKWHRVVFIWDGSNRILYVDDMEVARDTQNDLASAEGDLYLGVGNDLAPNTLFSGLIDDVRIYNQVVHP